MTSEKSAIKSYHDLLIWQKGIQLAKEIYLLTEGFPVREQYGLTNQLRRAAVSIPSNIAEGQARQHTNEFKQFLHISLGSIAEVDTQLVIAMDLHYTNENATKPLFEILAEIRRMIYSLIQNLPSR